MTYAHADEIDKKTLEIRAADDDVYTDMTAIADELPDHAPRFVLLSYPLTLVRLFPSATPLLFATPTNTVFLTGLGPPRRAVRDAVLPAGNVQQRGQDAVRGRKGAHAQYG